jgi:hypothetical protein
MVRDHAMVLCVSVTCHAKLHNSNVISNLQFTIFPKITTFKLKMTAFWDMVPCSVVELHRRLRVSTHL